MARWSVVAGLVTAVSFAATGGCDENKRRDFERDLGKLDPRCGHDTLLDEEIVVGSGGWQFMPFSLKQTCSVTVTVKGLRDTGKGFRVDVTPGDAGDQLKKTGKFTYHQGFTGLKTRNFTKNHDLPQGAHGVLVQNSENLLFSMAVHVTVTTGPANE